MTPQTRLQTKEAAMRSKLISTAITPLTESSSSEQPSSAITLLTDSSLRRGLAISPNGNLSPQPRDTRPRQTPAYHPIRSSSLQLEFETRISSAPLDYFHLFDRLPRELQELIWYYSLPSPQIKEARADGRCTVKDSTPYSPRTMLPVQLLVCQSSRKLILMHYIPMFGDPARMGKSGRWSGGDVGFPEVDLSPYNASLWPMNLYTEIIAGQAVLKIYGPRRMYVRKEDVIYFNSHSFMNVDSLRRTTFASLLANISVSDRCNLRRVALDFEILDGNVRYQKFSLGFYTLLWVCKSTQKTFGDAFKGLNLAFPNLETLIIVIYEFGLDSRSRDRNERHLGRMQFYTKIKQKRLCRLDNDISRTRTGCLCKIMNLERQDCNFRACEVEAKKAWTEYTLWYEETLRRVAQDCPELNLKIPKISWKFGFRENSPLPGQLGVVYDCTEKSSHDASE